MSEQQFHTCAVQLSVVAGILFQRFSCLVGAGPLLNESVPLFGKRERKTLSKTGDRTVQALAESEAENKLLCVREI